MAQGASHLSLALKAGRHPLGGTSRGAFDQAVHEAVADDQLTSELMDAMLRGVVERILPTARPGAEVRRPP